MKNDQAVFAKMAKNGILSNQEARLLKAVDRCKTRKCSKFIQARNKIQPQFERQQSKACTQKSSKAFYDCSSKFFAGSNLEKRMKNVKACAEKRCSSERKKLARYRNGQNLL